VVAGAVVPVVVVAVVRDFVSVVKESVFVLDSGSTYVAR
jgi:hypothetical protein